MESKIIDDNTVEIKNTVEHKEYVSRSQLVAEIARLQALLDLLPKEAIEPNPNGPA